MRGKPVADGVYSSIHTNKSQEHMLIELRKNFSQGGYLIESETRNPDGSVTVKIRKIND